MRGAEDERKLANGNFSVGRGTPRQTALITKGPPGKKRKRRGEGKTWRDRKGDENEGDPLFLG